MPWWPVEWDSELSQQYPERVIRRRMNLTCLCQCRGRDFPERTLSWCVCHFFLVPKCLYYNGNRLLDDEIRFIESALGTPDD